MDWFLYERDLRHKRVKYESHKIVTRTQAICRQQLRFVYCMSVFGHLVGLALKWLNITLDLDNTIEGNLNIGWNFG